MKAKPNTDEDRFYVYGHFTEDTNELFYIGKGCAKRAWSKVGRPQRWQDIATKGYTVKLLHEKLTESESLVLETALITSERESNPLLVNKRAFMNKIELNYEMLNDLFYYDESSPSFLRRKIDVISSSGRVARYKDGEVGWKAPKGWYTEVDGVSFAIHRIVYLLHTGSIDLNLPIDHINGNCWDNRIENLRQVTNSVNGKNRIIRNKTEASFIHFKESKRHGIERDSYFIKFDLKGKRVTVNFTVSEYGSKEAAFEACKEYKESIRDVLLLIGIPERVIDYGS